MHRSHSGVHEQHGRFAHPGRNVAALGIEPGMKIADFGAGSGAYVLAIADILGTHGTVYAIDIQKDLLRRIKNIASQTQSKVIEILCGDVETVEGSKLGNNTLDLVLISNTLFQVDNKQAVFEEARRVIKKGGRVAVIDWKDSFGGLGPSPAHVYVKEKAYEDARDTGLTFVKEFDPGAHHYGLIFRKTTPQGRS